MRNVLGGFEDEEGLSTLSDLHREVTRNIIDFEDDLTLVRIRYVGICDMTIPSSPTGGVIGICRIGRGTESMRECL